MKILSCYIEDFGSLHHLKCSLKDGLNSLNEKNGWGKSTFAVFLRAMFYGLENCKNSSNYDPKDYRKNLKPWQGGNFGGYIEFETSGKRYRVTRFFGERKREDTFELLDLDHETPSEDYTASLGEELFGIDAAGYERSVYIPHNDLQAGTNDSINARLLGLLENDGDMNNYEKAVQILNDARRELKKTGGRGKIDRDSDTRAGLEVRLRKAREDERAAQEKKAALAEAVREKDAAKNEREQADRELADFTQKSVGGGGKAVMMVFGIIMILLGLVSGGTGVFTILKIPTYVSYGIILAAVGGIAFLTGLVLLIVRASGIRRNTKQLNALQNKVAECRKKYEAAYERENTIKGEIDAISRGSDNPDALRAEIERLQNSNSEDNQKLAAIERTMRLLGEARQSLSAHYMDSLRRNFTEYLKEAGIAGNGATIDSELNIGIESGGVVYSLMFESSGIKDLVNLCARYALIDALYENDKPCIVLDDIMNNLDEERFKSAMKMTERLAKNYQIIYLTCNSSRMPV